MPIIFESIFNTDEIKKYRFSKKEANLFREGIEITINRKAKEFIVTAAIEENDENDNKWKLYDDSTFPSSLLREYLEEI